MAYRKYLIGEIFENNKGLKYIITSYSETKNNRHIKFLETQYECEVSINCIKSGSIRDWWSKGVCGIGIMDVKNGESHLLKKRWENMIRRCYDETYPGYINYGKVGCYVDERWHRFSNYIEDIEKKQNYDKLKLEPNKWHIDKDILIKGNKCYSNETTLIVSTYDNYIERLDRSGNPNCIKPVIQFDLNMNFIQRYESIRDAERKTGHKNQGIGACCKRYIKTYHGFIWRYEHDFILK